MHLYIQVKRHARSTASRKLRRYNYHHKIRKRFRGNSDASDLTGRDFKKYSSELPVGPVNLQCDETSDDQEATDSSKPAFSNTVSNSYSESEGVSTTGSIPIGTCCSEELGAVLLPVEETSAHLLVSSDTDDIVHVKSCTEHVIAARQERDGALLLAKKYREETAERLKTPLPKSVGG